MAPSRKRMEMAEAKRELVVAMAAGGSSKADAIRAVKKRFGSGIATRDVSEAYLTAGSLSKRTMPAGRVIEEEPVPEVAWHEREVVPKAKNTSMRRFLLDRSIDATGTSGIGIVAEGVQFSNGQVVIHWLSQLEAVNIYGNALVLEQLHGHNGNTVVKWVDP